ncbi:hypothetical protein CBR_g36767 [Chara braunii]|uniref:Protein kinase domain-containing protein n=1 Tax=Chara braunii TaxID=69332 RepID=A0A388LLM2_CHABU|nr:hypothetical protein CBR_g36767 [Chara braunii]|eukprot:GBG83151.1 hypothetical protein CBR_g36767 [Chara braunii]
MAPEIASQSDTLEGSADIWSLGCTVIEMATGRAPWSDVEDTMSTLFRIACTNEVPAFPPHLSSEAKDFLSKCLVREPSRRWSASQLLEHPFLADARHEAVDSVRRGRRSANLVARNSHPVGFPARATQFPADGLVSSTLGSEKETVMGDAVKEGGELCWGRERLTCTSSLLKAPEQEVSPRVVFDLPTSFGSELSLDAVNCPALAPGSFRQGNEASSPDAPVDGLGWECALGADKRCGMVGVTLLQPIECQDREAPVEGHLRRPCDPTTAGAAVEDGSSPRHFLLRLSSRRQMLRDAYNHSGARNEEAAATDKAEGRLCLPANGGWSSRAPCGDWIQVLRGRREQGCRVAIPAVCR